MKNIIIILIAAAILVSCDKKKKSTEASILNYSVTNSNISGLNFNPATLDAEDMIIFVRGSGEIGSEGYPLKITPEIQISEGATITPASGEEITFNSVDDDIYYTLKAEDGTQYNWYLSFIVDQIPNSDFEDWFERTGLNGLTFEDPGKSEESTPWGTANMGTSTYGLYGVNPVKEGNNTYPEIVTGETTVVPVTAGSIFTGKFDINGAIANPTNPKKATDLGIPFINRPVSFKVKYKYQPGENYVKATLNNPFSIFGGFTVTPIEGTDSLHIYSTLEVRSGEERREIARAEIMSDETVNVFREVTVPFVYNSSETPTHILVVFTSSRLGNYYIGAVGSTLWVDDFELVYE